MIGDQASAFGQSGTRKQCELICPVVVMEDGRRVIKPMRYQCRPAGKPAIHDAKYPGTYNARRDNLA
jgi:hypothetical protein